MDSSAMLARHLTSRLLQALQRSPVVLLQGARQTGKSTLVQWLSAHGHKARYLTFDNSATLAAATRDPEAFLAGLDGPVVLDEVQLAPGLFRAIKLAVDRERVPGRFLLTGSANVLLLPKLSESLAGRMEILTLWPFSQGELDHTPDGLVDALFEPAALPDITSPALPRFHLAKRLVAGGYPELHQRHAPEDWAAWFGSYLTTILQRDVRAMADIEGLTQMPRLLALLAAQADGLLNIAELSRDMGLAQPTLKRYLTLLQATHLYQPLPAWSGNTRKRLIKREKVYLNDTGLLTYLLGVDAARLAEPAGPIGPVLESLVAQELHKQITWSQTQPSLFYFRTSAGQEVDFVLENRRGQIAGIEVKSSMGLGGDDVKGLAYLADSLGKRFVRGVILYQGQTAVPFAKNIQALPLTRLWHTP